MKMKAKRRHLGLIYRMMQGHLRCNNRHLGCHRQVIRRGCNNQKEDLWGRLWRSREYRKLWELHLKVMDQKQSANMMKLISTIQTDQTRIIKWCPTAAWWALLSIKIKDSRQMLQSRWLWAKKIKWSNAPLSKVLARASTMTMDLKWHKELNMTIFWIQIANQWRQWPLRTNLIRCLWTPQSQASAYRLQSFPTKGKWL